MNEPYCLKKIIKDLTSLAARTAHEVNRVYYKVLGEEIGSWEKLPDYQKESAIKMAGYIANNPGESTEDIYNWWIEENEDEWVVPILSYYELMVSQKVKYCTFCNVVRGIYSHYYESCVEMQDDVVQEDLDDTDEI